MNRPVVIEVWIYGGWTYAKTCMSVTKANEYIKNRKRGKKFRLNYTTKSKVVYK